MIPLPFEVQGARRPIVTWILIIANFVIFLYFYVQGPQVFNEAIRGLGMIPNYILKGERLYTLVTSMFMHGDWMHIIGNMLYLYVFGCPLEVRLGRLRFLVLYLACGLSASIIHIAVETFFAEPLIIYNPYGKPEVLDPLQIPCIGASGAISGLLGAYLNFFPHSQLRLLTFFLLLPITITLPASLFIIIWFLYQLWMGLLSIVANFFAGVAFWAHIGGFVAGWLATIAALRSTRRIRVVYYRGRIWYEIPVEAQSSPELRCSISHNIYAKPNT